MPASRSSVQVDFVAKSGDIGDDLWRDCFPPPLEGRFWYQTLEASGLEDQFSFHYAVISADGRPAGIAPCFVHDVPISLVAPRMVAAAVRLLSRIFPGADRQRTFFVGSPCSDEGTIGLIPGLELAEVMGGVCDAVCAKARRLGAPMVVFKDFREADLRSLKTLRERRRFFPMVSYPGTVVPLPAPDKNAYLGSLTHNQRHNFLKKLRRSGERLDLGTTVVEFPSERELAEITALFQQTYEKGRTKFERLDRRFFERISGRGPARFILQRDRASGEMVAFMLVFCLGERVINKFIGIDYRRAEGSFPYFRLFDAALDFAYATGARELQSGQTGYRAKLDLGHSLVPLFNICRHRNRLVNALFRTIGGRVTWQTLDGDLATFLAAHPEWAPQGKVS